MKKHSFLVVAFAATIVFASCGGKNNAPVPAVDSTEVVADSVEEAAQALAPETQQAMESLTEAVSEAVSKKDTKAVTTALANVAATYRVLVNAGKLDEAKKYGSAVKNFISQNAAELKNVAGMGQASVATTINNLVSSIENLPTTAVTTADEAKAAVVEDVVNLASPYIQKGAAAATAETAAAAIKDAPDAVKTAAEAAVGGAVENAKTTAKAAVENEMNKAATKADEAKANAQKKASDAVTNAQKKANDAVNDAANKALKGLGL